MAVHLPNRSWPAIAALPSPERTHRLLEATAPGHSVTRSHTQPSNTSQHGHRVQALLALNGSCLATLDLLHGEADFHLRAQGSLLSPFLNAHPTHSSRLTQVEHGHL